MPEAVKFNALGRGNGFPYCPSETDVTDARYWTSLSGWSKVNEPVDDAAKAASIEESRKLAMALFWNIYELKGSASLDEYGDSAYVEDTGGLTTQPKDRVCFERDTDFPFQSKSDEDGDAGASIFFRPRIRRLINDGEFIGFGIYSAGFSAGVGSDFSFTQGNVALYSRFNGEPNLPYEDVGYTIISNSIGDFNFVCNAYSNIGEAEGSSDATNRTTSASDLGDSLSIQLDSLDFYTYPA